jgi:hypothetical protein
VLTVYGDEPVRHARSEDAPLDRALAIGRLIFDQNLADGRGIVHDRNSRERKSAEHDRLFEMSPGPAFERIGPQGLQQRQRAERPCLRLRRRRSKASHVNRMHIH